MNQVRPRLPDNFRRLASVTGSAEGQSIVYAVGYLLKRETAVPIFYAYYMEDGDVLFAYEHYDIFALYRLAKLFGWLPIRPIDDNVNAFLSLLSRELGDEEWEWHKRTLSEDVLTQAALIIGDPIPMPIVQFVTEHPEVVPRFLTTLEIGAGTITWDESMAAAGILTPEQVEDLDARRKTLVYKYESVLRQFANSATRLWGPSYDDQVEFFHEKHSFLQRCLLLICEYIDEDENISYSTVAFLTVLVGFILSQEDQIENPPQDIDPFLALPILAWVKESGHLIGGLTEEQIFAQARLIFGRLVRGDRKRILLYEP